MTVIEYKRQAAVDYAREWAFRRNPRYFDFSGYGGDCTSFVSQCLYAGCGVMNYTPVYGWYYIDSGQRSASWSGTGYLYNFLTANTSVGPFGTALGPFPLAEQLAEIQPGDVAQLQNEAGQFYHTLLIVDTAGGIAVASHSYDAYGKALTAYPAAAVRYIHIDGARRW